MIKARNIKLIKALTMTALLSNSGLCTESDKKETSTTQGTPRNTQSIGYSTTKEGVIRQQLEKLDNISKQRRDILSKPTIIDLGVNPFDNVRYFLKNARIYGAKVNLTVGGITESQLDEIYTNHSEDIGELWVYNSASMSKTNDGETITSTGTIETPINTGTDIEDEDDITEIGDTPTPTSTPTDDEDDDISELSDTPTGTPTDDEDDGISELGDTPTGTPTDDEDDDISELGDTPTPKGPKQDTRKTSDSLDKKKVIENHLQFIERIKQQRRDVLRQPIVIDLVHASFDNVINFLMNARHYDVRAKLKVNGITEAQLHELLTNYAQDIEELDWAYRAASSLPLEDKGGMSKDTAWTNPDENDDDEQETQTGYTTGDRGDNIYDDALARHRARRNAARGRNPLRLDDLRDHLGQKAELEPIRKLLMDLNAEPPVIVAANDDQKAEKATQTILRWAATLIKDEKSDANTSVIEQVKIVQPQALVKMFCRGIKA
jgi:hypothetical protein